MQSCQQLDTQLFQTLEKPLAYLRSKVLPDGCKRLKIEQDHLLEEAMFFYKSKTTSDIRWAGNRTQNKRRAACTARLPLDVARLTNHVAVQFPRLTFLLKNW